MSSEPQKAKATPQPPAAEPWMRGTHTELDPLRRAVVHALELTREDVERHTADAGGLLFEELYGLPPVAFHLRHIVRSLDRLLTYADGQALSEEQMASLAAEREPGDAEAVLEEFRHGMERAIERVRRFEPARYGEPRGIGRKQLPTTVAGLLIHCAEHSQRHAGQVVTTCRMLRGLKGE